MKFSNLIIGTFALLSSPLTVSADQVGLRVIFGSTNTPESCSTDEINLVQKSMGSFIGIQENKKHQDCKSLCKGLPSGISCVSIDAGCGVADGSEVKSVPHERDYCNSACDGLSTDECATKYPGCGDFHSVNEDAIQEQRNLWSKSSHFCANVCSMYRCGDCSYDFPWCARYEERYGRCRVRKLQSAGHQKDDIALKHDVSTFLTECESKKQAAYDFVANGGTGLVSPSCVEGLEGMAVDCFQS